MLLPTQVQSHKLYAYFVVITTSWDERTGEWNKQILELFFSVLGKIQKMMSGDNTTSTHLYREMYSTESSAFYLVWYHVCSSGPTRNRWPHISLYSTENSPLYLICICDIMYTEEDHHK